MASNLLASPVRLTAQLSEQFAESARLQAAITTNLQRLGYGE